MFEIDILKDFIFCLNSSAFSDCITHVELIHWTFRDFIIETYEYYFKEIQSGNNDYNIQRLLLECYYFIVFCINNKSNTNFKILEFYLEHKRFHMLFFIEKGLELFSGELKLIIYLIFIIRNLISDKQPEFRRFYYLKNFILHGIVERLSKLGNTIPDPSISDQAFQLSEIIKEDCQEQEFIMDIN